MGRLTTRRVVLGLTSVLALAVPAGSDPGPDPFAACRERFAQNPADYESAFCFFQVTLDHAPVGRRRARVRSADRRATGECLAAARLRPRLSLTRSGSRRAPVSTGCRCLQGIRRQPRASCSRGATSGTFCSRSAASTRPRARWSASWRSATPRTDPLLKARAWSLQALHIQSSGGDLGHAFRLLKQAEAAIFPQGPYRLKRTNLNSLGLVAARMGRFDEALAIFHRLDALATEEGEAQTQAIAKYNVFNTTSMKESLLPSPGGRERLLRLVQQALDAGTGAQHQIVTIRSHSALAELLANAPGSRATALTHLRECLTLARKAQQPYDEAVCSWIEAALLWSDEPRKARAAEVRALEATTRANNPRTDAYSAGRHMRLSWNTKSRDEAIRDSLAAIDTVETLRALSGRRQQQRGAVFGLDARLLLAVGTPAAGRPRRGSVPGLLHHRTDAGALTARRAGPVAAATGSAEPHGQGASGGARGHRRRAAQPDEPDAGRDTPARQPSRARSARASRAGSTATDGPRAP